MSHQNPTHSSRYYDTGSSTNLATYPNNLPPFQSFPAADDHDPRLGPTSGYPPSQQDPSAVLVAHSSHRHRTADNHTTALSTFTPFPAAAPNHRYAPPEGSRAAQVSPIPPPKYAPETGSSYLPIRSSDAIRYPSGLPPGQPSPYAPPGPLTARPHVCEYCDSGFARAHDLRRHLETHKSERAHKCPNCQRPFSRKDAVQRHLVITQCTGPSTSSS